MKITIDAWNLSGLVTPHATHRPDDIAVVDGERTTTWGRLDARVETVARGMGAAGLLAGHRVAIALTNSLEFVETYLAVLRAGMVAVPVSTALTAAEVANVLRDCGARLIVADQATVATVRDAVGTLRHHQAAPGTVDPDDPVDVQQPIPQVVVAHAAPLEDEHAYADLDADGPVVVSPPDPEALAVLLYTSGTSSHPRAAMLTHRALLANVRQNASTDPAPITTADRVLGVVPFSHVYGLNGVLGQVLGQGSTLIVGHRFDPEETLDLVQTQEVTVVPVAPPVIVAWNARDDIAERLRSVRLLLSGAAPLGLDVVNAFEDRTGIAIEQGYGLTECAPVVTSTIGAPRHKRGSSGRALPGIEMQVVDDRGHPAEPDDPGEIWVRGDNLFSGYWPDSDNGPDEQGWLATGDIGFVDHEGDLFLVDRIKELVIVSGFNVYPSEVEDVVSEVAGVAETAVIGVPDERTGEAVRVYVVAQPGAGDDLTDRVRHACGLRLARFKQPTTIEVVERLPHSATGKVAKGRLRAVEQRRRLGLA